MEMVGPGGFRYVGRKGGGEGDGGSNGGGGGVGGVEGRGINGY